MEISRKEISERQKEKGVIASFLMESEGDMDCGDVYVHEFPSHYQVVMVKEEKMDQLDLSTILFDFVASHHFDETKPLTFGENVEVSLAKNEDYTIIFKKLNPLYPQKKK